MRNAEIKNKLKESKIFQWQVASKLGMSEMTLVRKLRYELSEADKQRIFKAIDELAIEKRNKEDI